MSAGTITLTNGSAVVGGAGTSFATELAAGDFIVSTVGGVPYTLPVKTVDGNTQVTLVSNFTGPTQAGAAWSAVPRVALNMVTAALVAQSAEALRGLNYDKQNWQQVFSAAGNITVKLPDGTTFTGPSWKYLSDNMATKSDGSVPVNQGGTGSTTASGARTNLGLGNSATRNVGTTTGTVAAGNDSRLETVDGKTGGNILSSVTVNGSVVTNRGTGLGVGSGGNYRIEINAQVNEPPTSGAWISWERHWWYSDWVMYGAKRGGGYDIRDFTIGFQSGASFVFTPNGNATAPGTWTSSSDKRLKENIRVIEDPLIKMTQLRGYTWDRLDGMNSGIGFVAQEVRKVFPQAVYEGNDVTLSDGTIVEKAMSVDGSGVSAALHHEAILALMEKIEKIQLQVKNLVDKSTD